MAHDRFAAFRELVLHDPALQAQLRETPDKPAFIERMLQLGAELGYEFGAEEIEAALVEARRDWTKRRSVR